MRAPACNPAGAAMRLRGPPMQRAMVAAGGALPFNFVIRRPPDPDIAGE
jgi:hypothetical protein